MVFTIASFPVETNNPYLGLFYGALAPYGVEVFDEFRFSPRWLFATRGALDAVHIHWPEQLWHSGRESKGKALLKLEALMVEAGAFGIKRIWTVHNLDPHEGVTWADRIGFRIMARHSDLLICHTDGAAEQVRRRYNPRGRIVVMPHGSYAGRLPEPRPRAEALRALGLEEGPPILCCIGRLRDYKGLDVACEAQARLRDDTRLVIGGIPHPGFDMAPLKRYAQTLPGVTLIDRHLSDQELADVLSVSEAALLPYRAITGSGALLAAWTQGCGVVASDLAFFREMIPEGSEAGRLFEPGSASALADTVRVYLAVPHERRRADALAQANRYGWEECVKTIAAAVGEWKGAERA